MKWISGLLLMATLMFMGCKEKIEKATLKLDLSYVVDGNPLQMNSIQYQNAAGYNYSITKLVYYISNVKLLGDGIDDFQTDMIHYVDITNPSTNQITITEVPYGQYRGIQFTLGVDASRNTTGGLENNTINNNMSWPDQMGGGYHHMKLEGLWLDGNNTSAYLMHLGTSHHSNCYQNRAFKIDSESLTQGLTMNINEWYRTPAVYDFASDGTSIMMNDASMEKLARNGDDSFDN